MKQKQKKEEKTEKIHDYISTVQSASRLHMNRVRVCVCALILNSCESHSH